MFVVSLFSDAVSSTEVINVERGRTML